MDKPQATTKDKFILAVVLALLAAAVAVTYLGFPSLSGDEAAEEVRPVAEGPTAQAQPIAPVPTIAPTATPPTYAGDDAESVLNTADPGFKPSSNRQPQPGDSDAARAVLLEVLPRWGGIDLTGDGIAPDTWAKEVARPGGVTPLFSAWSQTEFYSLWGGIIQMDASAKVLEAKVDKELWNGGSHSMWRVSITRAITEDASGQEILRETIPWDILVALDNEAGPELDYFTATSEKNEKPETFYQPPIPRY